MTSKMSPEKRARIYAKTNSRCGYCGNYPDVEQIDHLIPKKKGGGNTEDNLMLACRRCNNLKKSKTPQEFKAYIFGAAHLEALQKSLKREELWFYLIDEKVEPLLDRTYLDCIEKLEALVETSKNNVTFYYETLGDDNE